MPAQFVLVVPTGSQMGAVEQARVKENQVNINGSEDQFYRYTCPQLPCTAPNAHASKMPLSPSTSLSLSLCVQVQVPATGVHCAECSRL